MIPLPVDQAEELQMMTLSADGTHIIVSAATNTSDIWLLEQFEPPGTFWRRWFR